jgi:hypothetical protein
MKLTRISLDKDNRMLRLGMGKNDSNWFARVDLWYVGYRITR